MLLFGDTSPEFIVSFIITAIIAFAYHEFAHAIVADYLGDPTPRSYGRISLNPIVHLDLFGIIMLVIAGFGWATTPVNPNMLRGDRRKSMAIVAVAGPLANLLMACIFGLLYRLLFDIAAIDLPGFVATFLQIGVGINLLLFAFNLMPIPPLDGFTILLGILPAEMAYRLEPVRRYGMIILLVAIFMLPQAGIDILGLVIDPVFRIIRPLIIGF